jgi:hypothetical protein
MNEILISIFCLLAVIGAMALKIIFLLEDIREALKK